MRRPGLVIGLLLLVLPGALPAQAHRWALSAEAGFAGFSGAARDTSGSDLNARIHPGQAPAFGIGLVRRGPAWEGSLALSVLTSRVVIRTDELDVVGRTVSLDRVRIAPALARRLMRLGQGSLALRAGPTLDLWRMTEGDSHTALGATVQLALRVPAGGFELENVVGWGWSGGPFDAGDLPDGFEPRSLRSLTIGASLRFGL